MSHSDAIFELLARFGFSELRDGQREVMAHLLEGRSSAAVFPTGGGKSLCYQLPALAFDGLTLVVSPLIALMKDQIDQLASKGIRACRLDSSLTADEYRAAMEGIRDGSVKLLYVAPERFNNERFLAAIAGVKISLMAIDEAHCISEWGHNFRPDYLKLAEFAKQCGAERVLALTATATPKVLEDIRAAFDIDPSCAIRTPFHRPNLHLAVSPTTPETRDEMLVTAMGTRRPGPTIVYVTLQKTAERVAKLLSEHGFQAKAYHAGMNTDQRTEIQDWFMSDHDIDHPVVVATIAFGMGVDKSNIRYVYHYNFPKSLENYSQEIGRAGRDGEPSTCDVIASLVDLRTLENFIHGDTPAPKAIDEMVQWLVSEGEQLELAIGELSHQFDIRQLVIRTLLTYLELDGYLKSGTPFYSSYQFQALLTSQEILAKFEGERRTFLERLFRLSRKARKWLHIDVDRAAVELATTRDRVVKALDYLGEQQMLEVRAAGVRQRYEVVRPLANPKEIAASLSVRMLKRERAEIQRLRQVIELFTRNGCLTDGLSGHFGEPLNQPCGHCSYCTDHAPVEYESPPSPAAMDESVFAQLPTLVANHQSALPTHRAIARFLCGISSPRASRARLGSHKWFGVFEDTPFDEVLQRVESFSGITS